MDIYLVGGAVRDELLGFTATEHDWVVVGSSVAEMKSLNFEQVGKDFPVFLHPTSKEEYALARIERKISAGHTGFECDASATVTLEEDLLRRDLTINAIAKNADGEFIDPYHGKADLDQRVLRHVSAAFAEDPLRILRLARFYARFADFHVAEETLSLVTSMVADNQLAELPGERVWTEVQKALATNHPARFFELLSQVGAHEKLWPSILEAKIELLKQIESRVDTPEQRFAALCDQAGIELAQNLNAVKAPKRFAELAEAASRHLQKLMVTAPDAEFAIELIYQLDALRRPDRFKSLATLAASVATVKNLEPPANWPLLIDETLQITAAQLDATLEGPQIGEALRQARVRHLKTVLAR